MKKERQAMIYYSQFCIKYVLMKKYTKIGVLYIIIYWVLCQNIQSQEIDVNDSIDHIIQNQIVENIPYKKNQLKIEEGAILRAADALPAFGMYKDTYFTTGIPLNQTINRNTSDAI